MNSSDYKKIISLNDVLSYSSLDVTLKELTAIKDFEAANEVQRILKQNKITKPELHKEKDNINTDYYKVDISSKIIERITNMFFDLESEFVSTDGLTTPDASFYGLLCDIWKNVLE